MNAKQNQPYSRKYRLSQRNALPRMWLIMLLLLAAAKIDHADSSLPSPQQLASTPSSAASPRVTTFNSEQTTNETIDHDEWRTLLPQQLRNEKGAPLHRIILEFESHPGRAKEQYSHNKKVTLYLLGTSHVSRTSCQDAKLLMEHVRPGE